MIILKMIENWERPIDTDCYGILIAKLSPYGLDFYSSKLLASYLFNRY